MKQKEKENPMPNTSPPNPPEVTAHKEYSSSGNIFGVLEVQGEEPKDKGKKDPTLERPNIVETPKEIEPENEQVSLGSESESE